MARGQLPAVDRLATEVEAALVASDAGRPRPVIRDAARRVLERVRPLVREGDTPGVTTEPGDLVSRTLVELGATTPTRRVINATGVLLHTNLGRAPLPLSTTGQGRSEGSDREEFGAAYEDVEFDLDTGRRGRRFAGLDVSLCSLTGAPAALVVNNNAAAVLLTLASVAAGAEVVVSRGELVEIGGSFRIPEVITQGGAVLREVGTTNRTHLADYRGALGDDTGAVLSVHRSNYRIEGFTAQVGHRDLAGVARIAGVPLVVDLGGGLPDTRCGWLPGDPPAWLAEEPGVCQVLAAGADVVTFSGDKLLGGPQAGIIVGSRSVVEPMRRHPLARAVRLDRVRARMLQQVVDSYLDGTAAELVPFWAMASTPTAELEARASAIVDRVENLVDGGGASIVSASMDATVGAGAAPGSAIPGTGIEVSTSDCSPDALAARLRASSVPVVGVVGDDRLRLHLRTVDPADDGTLIRLLVAVLET